MKMRLIVAVAGARSFVHIRASRASTAAITVADPFSLSTAITITLSSRKDVIPVSVKPVKPLLNPEQIAELVELYKQTTQGEWIVDGENVRANDGELSRTILTGIEGVYSNAGFTAAAHNAMPALSRFLELHNTEYGTCGHHPCHQYDLREFGGANAAHGCVSCERDRALGVLAEKDVEIESQHQVTMMVMQEADDLRAELQQANERAEKAEAALTKVAVRLQEQARYE